MADKGALDDGNAKTETFKEVVKDGIKDFVNSGAKKAEETVSKVQYDDLMDDYNAAQELADYRQGAATELADLKIKLKCVLGKFRATLPHSAQVAFDDLLK
jgi:hypothetical protein